MRLVALTAVAMLGTGCFVSSSDPGSGDAFVYWNFRNFDNVTAGNFTAGNPGCDIAAVTEVDVEVLRGGARVDFFTATCQATNNMPGTAIPNLRPGTYTLVLTAYRGADPVFEGFDSFTIGDGLETTVQTTLDVLTPQPLSIFFSKAGVFNCTGVASVYYSLSTSGGALVSSNEIACPSNQELYLPAASTVGANYRLDFLQTLDAPLPAGGATFERCSVGIRHTGFPAVIDLLAAPDPACG